MRGNIKMLRVCQIQYLLLISKNERLLGASNVYFIRSIHVLSLARQRCLQREYYYPPGLHYYYYRAHLYSVSG